MLLRVPVSESSDSAHGAPASQPSPTGLEFRLMRANGVYILKSVQERSRAEHLKPAAEAVSGKAPPTLHQMHGHFRPALLAGHRELGLRLFIHNSQSVSQSV